MKKDLDTKLLEEAYHNIYEQNVDKWEIGQKLKSLYYKAKEDSSSITKEDVMSTKEYVKQIGGRRTAVIFSTRSEPSRFFPKAGFILDTVIDAYRQHNTMDFDKQAPTTTDLAKQIAQATNGTHEAASGEKWQMKTPSGQNYYHYDAKDLVVYPDEESFKKAKEWLEDKGKVVVYKDPDGITHDSIQIGKFVVSPENNKMLIRTVSMFKNMRRMP